MASLPIALPNTREAVEQVARDLIAVRHWGDTSFVSLPLIAPDGSFITVRVTPAPGGFRIDDFGFTYRGLESVGGERSFSAAAAHAAERESLTVDRRMIFVDAGPNELARAICDVGTASWNVLDRVFSKLSDDDEAEIEDYLRERLSKIFGASHVDKETKIVGSSTKSWDVSAILHMDGKLAVFQAVGQHANSVYKTSAAFHDLSALAHAPRLISVVKDKTQLGPNLSLLAQAGHVIQGDQPDEAYVRAAA